ncbi:MAG TPA: iron-sulfur cluster assembly accessory protein [Candidatus Paceibacterota bacterium]
MTITLADSAVEKIKALVGAEYGKGLRIKVVGGGCSGLKYKMELEFPHDTDKVFERNGARIIVDKKSFLYLAGTEVAYQESLAKSGFHIINPRAKRTCGCGESFSV